MFAGFVFTLSRGNRFGTRSAGSPRLLSEHVGRVRPASYRTPVLRRVQPNGPKLRVWELGGLLNMPISAVSGFVALSRVGATGSFADARVSDVAK